MKKITLEQKKSLKNNKQSISLYYFYIFLLLMFSLMLPSCKEDNKNKDNKSVSYDLINYYSLNKGNYWIYNEQINLLGDSDDNTVKWRNQIVIEDAANQGKTKIVENENLIQRSYYNLNYGNKTNPDNFDILTYDSDFIYLHGEYYYNDNSSYYLEYVPHVKIKRELTKSKPYFFNGNFKIHRELIPFSYSIEIEDIEDVNVPAGYFSDCLKIKICKTYGEKANKIIRNETRWLANKIGIVKVIQSSEKMNENTEIQEISELAMYNLCEDINQTTIASSKMKYKSYADESKNKYSGGITLADNDKYSEGFHISEIILKDNFDNTIEINNVNFNRSTYFVGFYNSQPYATIKGPVFSMGFSFQIDSEKLETGWYSYELKTKTGDKLKKSMYYPGTNKIDTINKTKLNSKWNDDGSLNLSWDVPDTQIDQICVNIYGVDKYYGMIHPMLFIIAPPYIGELTISSEDIKIITDYISPNFAVWVMEFQSISTDNFNYASTYSEYAEIDWNFKNSEINSSALKSKKKNNSVTITDNKLFEATPIIIDNF